MAFFAALLFVASFSAASELEIVRQNIVRFITGTGADTTQQYVRQALVDLSNTAQSYLTQLDTSGKWSSIDYTQPLGQEPWKAGAHYGRLLTMAEAFATPGNSLYHSQTLLNGITRGLKFIHTHVHRGSVLGGNWWYWDIGVPKNYGQTLLLVYSHLDSAVLANGIDDLDYLKSLSKTLNVISPNGDDVTRSNNDLY
ncbi:MAG: hypothetical protein JNL74_22350, partial [Fibrobacteres bacterium]|nr:hypothetical protein [Fibrobacterota bacterium]